MKKMKRTMSMALMIALALPMLAVALQPTKPAADAKPAAGPPIEELAWLAGDWASEDDKGSSEEQWMSPRAGTMIGMNRSIKKSTADGKTKERTASFEYLQIVSNERGMAYLASPAGRHPPTVFRLKGIAPNRVVFENPQHDFPQLISYHREGDALHAKVEGMQGGKPALEEWTWQRLSK